MNTSEEKGVDNQLFDANTFIWENILEIIQNGLAQNVHVCTMLIFQVYNRVHFVLF